MIMTPQEKEAWRAEALDVAMQAALVAGLLDNHKPRLRQVLTRR